LTQGICSGTSLSYHGGSVIGGLPSAGGGGGG